MVIFLYFVTTCVSSISRWTKCLIFASCWLSSRRFSHLTNLRFSQTIPIGRKSWSKLYPYNFFWMPPRDILKEYSEPCQISKIEHCMKSVQIRSFFWSLFFHIRTAYRVSLQFKCGKIRTRKNSVFGHFSRGKSHPTRVEKRPWLVKNITDLLQMNDRIWNNAFFTLDYSAMSSN